MLSLILGFITGLSGPISDIVRRITDLKLQQLKIEGNIERARINQQIEEAHDRQAVLIAEAGQRLAGALNASIRTLLTLGPAVFLLKVFIWDKVIGSFYHCAGSLSNRKGCESFLTDALDFNLWAIIFAIIAFYFVYDITMRMRK